MSQLDPTARGQWKAALEAVLPESSPVIWTNVHLIGPFDNSGHQGLFMPYPPEQELDLDGVYPGKDSPVRWVRTPELDGAFAEAIDLGSWIEPQGWSAVFLYAEVEIDRHQLAELSAGGYGIVHGMFNGIPVLAPAVPYPAPQENHEFLVALRPGVNTLLLKFLFYENHWVVQCGGRRLGDPGLVASGMRKLITTSGDSTVGLVAHYAMVELNATLGDEDGTHSALASLRDHPMATRWDVRWGDSVAFQHAATGRFLPLHDVRQEYAPVANPQPLASFWPQSAPPSAELLVVDAASLTAAQEFALSVLQGLVNRTTPRLYLLHRRYREQDLQWLSELRRDGYTSREIAPSAAWATFRGEIRGAVLYDGTVMDEIGEFHSHRLNVTTVAMMICALEDAVPLTAEANQDLGLPVVFDARDRWDDQYEMNRWAYQELFPRMDHRILATSYPGIFYLTDYLVAFRVFTFWFPEHRTLPEANLLAGILASTPPNTPIVGWWFDWMPNPTDHDRRHADAVMETPGLLLGSFFGKVLTPSHEATNLTVHSGVAVAPCRHQEPKVPELDPSKVYYANIMSDGDNLGEALMMRTRSLQWDKPERGAIPMGWSFAPAASRMAPTVLNYYLRTVAPGDLLVGGLGVGYTHPTIYLMAYPEERDELYAAYARLTDEALSWIDTSCLWLIDGGDDDEDRYARESSGQLRGIFTGYGGSPQSAAARLAPNDVVAFRSATRNTEFLPHPKDDLVSRMVSEIRDAAGDLRPSFLEAWVLNWDWRLDMLEQVRDELGPDFVCVRPDVLVSLRLRAGAESPRESQPNGHFAV